MVINNFNLRRVQDKSGNACFEPVLNIHAPLSPTLTPPSCAYTPLLSGVYHFTACVKSRKMLPQQAGDSLV